MKAEQDYIRDIAEMRAIMERSTRFLSLSGLSGVMAGVYALAGAYVAHSWLDIEAQWAKAASETGKEAFGAMSGMIMLGAIVLAITLVTALLLSRRKAAKNQEKTWNPATRRLLANLGVPLLAGGTLILILITQGLPAYALPFSLVFYGLALYSAGRFTYEEIRSLGLLETALGLAAAWMPEHALLLWAFGFGALHIVYGLYMHYRYER
jgi:uncharacterized membrane protein